MSKRLIALTATVAAIAAIAASCGSSDDDSTASTATLTKAEFIEQGDAICRQGDAEIKEGFEDFAKENDIPDNQEPSTDQGVEIVETVIVPNIKTQGELIRGLGAPAGDEDEVDALLDALDEAVEAVEDDPEVLFDEKTDPFGEVNKQAQAYGLEVCGQG